MFYMMCTSQQVRLGALETYGLAFLNFHIRKVFISEKKCGVSGTDYQYLFQSVLILMRASM